MRIKEKSLNSAFDLGSNNCPRHCLSLIENEKQKREDRRRKTENVTDNKRQNSRQKTEKRKTCNRKKKTEN